MVDLTIDGKAISVEEGTTILAAARAAGIDIPTLCYFDGLNDIGACRVCVVEVEGADRLEAACNTAVRAGMCVTTDSPRVLEARRTTLELLLSQHDLHCPTCVRCGTCRFQALLLEAGLVVRTPEGPVVAESPYERTLIEGRRAAWPEMAIIQRDTNLCVKCGRCVAACGKLESIGVWAFTGSGASSNVGVHDGLPMRAAGCVACGQCITHCPTGALSERDDIQKLLDAIADPEVTTVVQVAPATRTSWGVGLGAEDGSLSIERMAGVLKQMGVDYVFDTSFAADLTIMEEGTELLEVLGERVPDANGVVWPMFTSCCPAWVSYAKGAQQDVVEHLSTAKSPMMMFGAVVKTWFAKRNGLDPAKIFSVALMPCTAKKAEIMLPMQSNPGIPDMNASLTTRELVRMVRAAGIDVNAVADAPLDDPLGEYTGAGVIFGTTGGVMEAALRSAYYFMTGQLPDPEGFVFQPAAGGALWKEAEFEIDGTVLRCAVVSGLADANMLLDEIRHGKASYDFVEVMACPSGCAGGGGQPIDGSDRELGLKRGATLRRIDRTKTPLRYSHENPVVQRIYEEHFEAPCSHAAHEYLHTEHV